MKIEELLFAMSDENNEYLGEGRKCETDEGCFLSESPGTLSIRRAKSTPNLLQIPSHIRTRKRSDDSAVGSGGEDSEISDKLSDNFTANESSEVYNASKGLQPRSADMSSSCVFDDKLRPPSVVVSDHDLYPEGYFLTLDDLDAEFNLKASQRRRLSDCSTCSSLSFAESEFGPRNSEEEFEEEKKSPSGWKRVRTIVHQLTPFIQTYKKHSYPWVQLAGHQGNFKPGEQHGTILKKFCQREKEAFEILMSDSLKPFVPTYYGIISNDDKTEYVQLQDLLGDFHKPCVMDCKIGVRTYLEEELMKAREKPKLRKDMYEKMCQIDNTAPTSEEHQLRGVTKPRYMVWRETISTTSSLGFRIEGIRKNDGTSSRDFKTTRTESQVKDAFKSFIQSFPQQIEQYLQRLRDLREKLEKSKFFATHEVIGSSLLFVHDSQKASLWMIDFAKTCPLPENCNITHSNPWTVGNHEDGYLIGLSNLIKIFQDLQAELI